MHIDSNHKVCGKTGCKQPQYASIFLTWTIKSFTVKMLRGVMPIAASREYIRDTAVHFALLSMRVQMFLAAKFDFNDTDLDTLDVRTSQVLPSIFGDMLEFHRRLPRGKSVADVLRSGEVDAPPEPAPWSLGCIKNEYLRKVSEFLRDLYDEREDIAEVAQAVMSSNANVTAEQFLANKDLIACGFDFQSVYGDFSAARRALTQPLPPAAEAAPQPLPPPPVDSLAEAASMPPAVEPEAYTADVLSNVLRHFTHLSFSPADASTFNDVKPALFDRMVSWARVRASDYNQYKIRAEDVEAVRLMVQTSMAYVSAGPGDRCLYVYNPVHTTHAPEGRLCTHAADLSAKDLTKHLEVVFGPYVDKEISAEDRAKQVLFQARGSSDAFLVSDGRRISNDKHIESELRKAVSGQANFYKKPPYLTVRMLYHNREFASPTVSDDVSRKYLTYGLPEPLENMYLLVDKGYRAELTRRRFLDLPGDNRCRGLNNLSLRPGVCDGRRSELPATCTVDVKTAVLVGCKSQDSLIIRSRVNP